MRRSLVCILLPLAACAHTDISVNTGTSLAPPPSTGTRIVSSGAGLQVNASGGVAAALVAGVVIAGTVHDLHNPEPAPSYQSLSDWFWGRPAPAMDPSRTVNEQDCREPVEGSGNLKCR